MSAPSRTALSTNIFDRVCIVCATPSKFCTHYASAYSKAGTPTLATSCVYGSSPHVVMGLGTIPFVNQMERFTVVLHLHRTWHSDLSLSLFPSTLILRSMSNPSSNTAGMWKFGNVLTLLLSGQTT
jgi:hypothetical protein